MGYKIREDRLKDAVDRLVTGCGGQPKVAEILEVSTTTVQKWTDSDHIIGSSQVVWDAGVPAPELLGHEAEAGADGAGQEEAEH